MAIDQVTPMLNAVAQLSWVNTGILYTNVYVQSVFAMVEADAWPALHVDSGDEAGEISSFASYFGGVSIATSLYDEWVDDNILLEQKWQALGTMLAIIKSNLLSNPSLVVGNFPLSTSIQRFRSPGYRKGAIKTNVVGKDLIEREMTTSYGILPYDALP